MLYRFWISGNLRCCCSAGESSGNFQICVCDGVFAPPLSHFHVFTTSGGLPVCSPTRRLISTVKPFFFSLPQISLQAPGCSKIHVESCHTMFHCLQHENLRAFTIFTSPLKPNWTLFVPIWREKCPVWLERCPNRRENGVGAGGIYLLKN